MRNYSLGGFPKAILAAIFCVLLALGLIWRGFPSKPAASSAAAPKTPASGKLAASAPAPSAPQPAAAAPKAGPSGDPGKELARLTFATGWAQESKPAFAPFNAWVNRYLSASASDRQAMEQEGASLAAERLKAMEQLIQSDPEEAIASTVPARILPQLPALVLSRLEKRVAGNGNYDVKVVCFLPAEKEKDTDAVMRKVALPGQSFKAFVYGSKVAEGTKYGIPMQGVAVGNLLALHESPVRVLEQGEAAPANLQVINPPAATPGEATVNLQVGNYSIPSISVSQAIQLQADIAKAEAKLGPYVQAQGFASQLFPVLNPNPPLPWTTGTQRILIIRVDFPDITGAAATQSDTQTLMDTSVTPFYEENSFHKDTQVTTVSTTTYRMPHTGAYYAVNGYDDQLHSDAENLAASDYNLANYDRIGVVFPWLGSIAGSFIDYGGLAQIQGRNFWVNGSFDVAFRVLAHELGHTYGLYHANLWQIDNIGGSPNGSGSSIEYGDDYDTMGANFADVQVDFGPSRKQFLGWIDSSTVVSATASGVFRVYRFDDPAATGSNTLAVSVPQADGIRSYWISYRKKNVTAADLGSNLTDSAYIFWKNNVQDASGYPAGYTNLLDCTTPGSDITDAGLALGSSLRDPVTGAVITPLATGGTSPNEYMDVQVSYNNSVGLAATSYQVKETDGSVAVIVNRLGDGVGTISVNYATVNGTATFPDDYLQTNGTFTWADGDLSSRTITVGLKPGRFVNGSVNFTVQLSKPVGGFIASGASVATVKINNPGIVNPGFTALPPADFNLSDGTPVIVSGSTSGPLAISGSGLLSGATGWFVTTSGSLSFTGSSAQLSGVNLTSGGINGDVESVVIQPDGAILAAGKFSGLTYTGSATLSGTDAGTLQPVSLPGNLTVNIIAPNLIRLRADGSLDTGFVSAGISSPNAIALQPDGRILTCGGIATSGSLARVNADGSVDNSFVPAICDGEVRSAVVQPDAKILIGGAFQTVGGITTPGVARLNADGSVDNTFVSPLASGSTTAIECLALQPDGNVLVGGNLSSGTSNGIARLLTSGSLDASFSPGISILKSGSSGFLAARVLSIAVKANGNIVIGGDFNSVNGVFHAHLAQLKADGSLDNTFAPSIDPGGGSAVKVKSLATDASGGLFVGGEFAIVNSKQVSRFARLNGDGTLDASFFVGSGAGNTVNSISLAGDGSVALGLSVNPAVAGDPLFQGIPNSAVTMLLGKNTAAGQVQLDFNSYLAFAGGSVQVMVERVGGSTGPISVNYSTVDGSAVAAVDYGAASGTLTWADGDASPKFIDLSITGSNASTFYIGLGTPIGGTQIGSQGWAPINIGTNNHVPNQPTNWYPSPGAVDVDNSWVWLLGSVYSDPDSNPQLAAQWMVFRDSDGALVYPRPSVDPVIDYNNLRSITLPFDLDLGATYHWQVRYMDSLGGWSAFSAPTSFTVRPVWAFQFSQPSYIVSENGGSVQVTVVRTSGTSGALYTGSSSASVYYQTQDGTAYNGLQYTGTSGYLNFSGTENAKTVSVPIIDNTIPNGNKQFSITLSSQTYGWEVPNPLAAVTIRDNEAYSFAMFSGNYSGLIGTDSPSIQSAGALSLSVDRHGVFSANIQYHGQTYRLKGQLGPYGDFNGLIPKTHLWVWLSLDMTGKDTLTGSILDLSSNDQIETDFLANRSVFDSVRFPSSQKGNYNVLLMASGSDLPQGTGYGTLSVDGSGKGRFAGALGDGTKVSQTLNLAKNGTWPLFIPLYKNQGSISGFIAYSSTSQANFDGQLAWFKPPVAKDPLFPGGFTATPHLVGTRYIAPAKGAPVPFPNARLTIFGGGVSLNTQPQLLTWGADYKLTNNTVPSTGSVKITIAPSTGVISGSFLDSSSGKTKSFSGVFLQKANIDGMGLGGGVFLGNGGTTGGFRFENDNLNK